MPFSGCSILQKERSREGKGNIEKEIKKEKRKEKKRKIVRERKRKKGNVLRLYRTIVSSFSVSSIRKLHYE